VTGVQTCALPIYCGFAGWVAEVVGEDQIAVHSENACALVVS
jgi:hypothetical protein